MAYLWTLVNVPVNSKTAHLPPGNPRAFDSCQALFSGDFDFDSARPIDYTWVFLLLSFYIVISWDVPLFKAWSEDKLNRKFVVAENFLYKKGELC